MAVLVPLASGPTRRKAGIRIRILLAAAAVSFGTRLAASPAGSEAREYQVKAVFLFNFAQFVEWPPGAFPAEGTPFVIGILGGDPFGSVMDETVRGEKVDGRSIAVRRFRRVEDIRDCHILYISRSESGRLEQILAALKGRSILTVSDADDFSHLGGMIRFVTENNRVRLRINNNAARSAGLRISSKLLRPSEVVSLRRN